MGLLATDKGTEFEMTPKGQYIGRCYRVIDLGTQTINGAYGVQEKHQIMLSWELIGKDNPKMSDGRPFAVHGTYTLTLSENGNLRPLLESWRGEDFTPAELDGFDISKLIGAYGIIQVVHSKDGKFANVQTIMTYTGEKPTPVNANVIFDIDNPDMKVFETFGDKMKAKIMAAPEWKGSQEVKPEPSKVVEEKDVVITEFDESEPINIDDIPF